MREVLDAGSGDTYSQYRPGQSFNLAGLQPGTYYIEVTINPVGKPGRERHDQNTALRRVHIGRAADSEQHVTTTTW